jgi:choline dehydrogenase-like flavoprotein
MGVTLVTPDIVAGILYDILVVGAGVTGAIVAKELSETGKKVLIIEAGTSDSLTPVGFHRFVENFYRAVDKNSNSPYPSNPNALSPTDDTNGYFQEDGPLPISGSYTRLVGGTTMHWEAKALRMLPEDFESKTRYGIGLDWPIGYNDLEPYYRKAEYELGVSGDTDEQRALGVPFPDGYVLPNYKIPPSYLDELVRRKIDGATVQLGGTTITLKLSTFPQARNGEANPNFAPGPGAKPITAGGQCQGNANCVPICPIRAKYDAGRTLASIGSPQQVHLLPQAVASKVEIDFATKRVSAIQFKCYRDPNSPAHIVGLAKAKLFVLACNAVENARLMLASNLPSSSGLIGRNLMDHPFLLAWALMPEAAGTMRGPLVTSGIGTFRKGDFRRKQAAFAMDIHNDGWGWSGTGAIDVLRDVVDNGRRYGDDLRKQLISRISRQILLAFMCEMPAESQNRITVNPRYTDQLGNYRPVISFNIPDYCKRTIAYTRDLSRRIFSMIGAEDHTSYDRSDPAYFDYNGEGYWFRGGNHFSGTHIMGKSKADSVVDAQLRSWDHPNLYLLGGGSIPAIGSANITLSIAALSFRAAEQIMKDLHG